MWQSACWKMGGGRDEALTGGGERRVVVVVSCRCTGAHMAECVLESGESGDEALTGGGGMRVVVVVVSCRCTGAHVAECVLENGRRWRWDTNRWGRKAGGEVLTWHTAPYWCMIWSPSTGVPECAP